MSNRSIRVSPPPPGCTCPNGTGFGQSRVHITGNTSCALLGPDPVPAPTPAQCAEQWGRDYVRAHDSNARITTPQHERETLLALISEGPPDGCWLPDAVHGAACELQAMRNARAKAVMSA